MVNISSMLAFWGQDWNLEQGLRQGAKRTHVSSMVGKAPEHQVGGGREARTVWVAGPLPAPPHEGGTVRNSLAVQGTFPSLSAGPEPLCQAPPHV